MAGKQKRAEAARKAWKKRKTDTHAESGKHECKRSSELKQWFDESMRGAMEAVKGGLMGVN